MFFFFSSRRRHTRFKCDWSSDVCSSDLEHSVPVIIVAERDRPISRLLLGNPAVVEVVKFSDLDGLRRALAAALAGVAAVRREGARPMVADDVRSEEHTSELQSHLNLVCRLL